MEGGYSKMWKEGEVTTSPGYDGQHLKSGEYGDFSPKRGPGRSCSSLSKKYRIKARVVIRALLLRRSSSLASDYWRISDTLECDVDKNHHDATGSEEQQLQRREQQQHVNMKHSGTKRWKIFRTLKQIIKFRSKKSSGNTK